VATVRALPIGAERLTGTKTFTVRAPYDGHELADVPAWNEEGVAREWKDWLDENARRLPRKLGQAKVEDE